ncbi:hypothetical protein ABIC16_000256 [Sphingomonas sp. PvP055]|uniref:hypothetical protein n=1 Tax=Sphingomonas sp. PvP055 TaxID=3156391 RepID=UPI0033930DB8
MPGGVIRGLDARSMEEIARRWPTLDRDAVNSAASVFQINEQHKAETPRDIRKKMDKIVKLAVGLRLELQTLSEEASDHLFWDCYQSNDVALFQAMPGILDRLKAAAMRSHNAEIGNDARDRAGPRQQLISSLAWQLENAGLVVDARPQGNLCLLADIVLHDLGEPSADLSRTVREALSQAARRQSVDTETIASG